MKKLIKIARFEFLTIVCSKIFFLSAILGPVLVLSMLLLSVPFFSLTNTGKKTIEIGVLGLTQNEITNLNGILKSTKFHFCKGENADKIKRDIVTGRLHGLIQVPTNHGGSNCLEYFSKTGTDIPIYNELRNIMRRYFIVSQLNNLGLDPELTNKLAVEPEFTMNKIINNGKYGENQSFRSILITCASFMLFTFMTILLYCQSIGRAVIKEKYSKTVEIMLSSVTSEQLMYGKIAGVGSAGILQYILYLAITAIGMRFLGSLSIPMAPVSLSITEFLLMALFFLLAYFLYAAIYAALGSAATDEQHIGHLGMPIVIILITPLAMVSYILSNPSSLPTVFLSHFPLTSSMVMLTRIIVDPPPLGEILVSIAILLFAIFVTTTVSVKIFRVGILMTGKRNTIGEIIRWVGVK